VKFKEGELWMTKGRHPFGRTIVKVLIADKHCIVGIPLAVENPIGDLSIFDIYNIFIASKRAIGFFFWDDEVLYKVEKGV